MTKRIFSVVDGKEDAPDFTQQPGEWKELADEFADAVEGALATFGAESPAAPPAQPPAPAVPDIMTLAARKRTEWQADLDALTEKKAAVEREIGELQGDLSERTARIHHQHDWDLEQLGKSYAEKLAAAQAKLKQIAAVKGAIDLAVGTLNQSDA